MTEQEINIAIAEACGWKHEIRRSYRETPAWFYGFQIYDDCPTYTRDLNAMHEAEKVLTTFQQADYVNLLYRANTNRKPPYFVHPDCFASATQRAEAFLRTICKWKEQPSENTEGGK